VKHRQPKTKTNFMNFKLFITKLCQIAQMPVFPNKTIHLMFQKNWTLTDAVKTLLEKNTNKKWHLNFI
jgi:hypothetical protein